MSSMKINKALLELLAYAAIVNNYIHSEQLKYLNKLIGNDNSLCKSVYNDVILNDDAYNEESANARINKLFSELKNENQTKIKRMLIKIMCYDGKIDEKELKFLRLMYQNSEYSKAYAFLHIDYFNFKTKGTIAKHLFTFLKSRLLKNTIPYIRFRRLEYNSLIKNLLIENENVEIRLKKILGKIEDYEIIDSIKNNSKKLSDINDDGPTLVLMGKTKAGKSTLFHLLSSVGSELVGKGGQRTSKCSTVTHYNGIKIIDTPGLAAASFKGKEDEKIAEKSCYNSDEILFLMPADTYGKELTFIDKFIDKNKPMTILFNYKNADHFQYDTGGIVTNPQKWRNNVENSANQLIRYLKERNIFHVIDNKLKFAFLREADKKWVLNNSDQKMKRKILTNWKKIRKASNYPTAMYEIFNDFYEHADLYRLYRLFETSLGCVVNLETEINDYINKNSQRISELKSENDAISKQLDNFVITCRSRIDEELGTIISDVIIDAEEKSRNNSKNKFNKYFKQIIQKANENMYENTRKILLENINGLSIKLKDVPIELSTFTYDKEDISLNLKYFETKGGFNIFKSKHLYDALSNVSARLIMKVNLPVGIGLNLVSSNIIDKIALSNSEQNDITLGIRNKEINDYLEEVKRLYLRSVESNMSKIKIIIQNKLIKPNMSEIHNYLKINSDLENAVSIYKNNIFDNYAERFLKQCQRFAKYTRYEVDSTKKTVTIFASHCKENVYSDLKYKIQIKKEGG